MPIMPQVPTAGFNPQTLVDRLNDLLWVDPAAIAALCAIRVPCNDLLRDHPHAVVKCVNQAGDFPRIGLLGVLNAIVGPEGYAVAMEIGDSDDDRPGVLQRFSLRPLKREDAPLPGKPDSA